MFRMTMKWMASAILVAGCFTLQARAQEEAYTADLQTSTNMGTQNRFNFRITKWSTQDEIKQLGAILKEKGQNGLLDAMKKLDAGYINRSGTTGNQIAVAEKFKNGDQTIITMIVARNMSMFETRNGAASEKYPFAFLQVTLNGNGEGTGKLVENAAIRYNKEKDTFKLDPYGQGARAINNVKPLKQ